MVSLLIAVSMTVSNAAEPSAAGPRPTYPEWVKEGLQVTPAGGMTVRVAAGVAEFEGGPVRVRGGDLGLALARRVRAADERIVLADEKPQGWAHGTSLPHCTCFGEGRVAPELGVGLAHASRRWEHLAAGGIPCVTLLFNGINHPDNRGHDLFVRGLMTFF